MTKEPRLIVVNQTVNPAFNDWLIALAARIGPIELWSGNAPVEVLPGVQVRLAPAYHRATIGARLRSWGSFTRVVTLALLRRGDQTPLFVVTNPPFMPLAAWLLHRWQQRPYAILEWDIYPHILVPMGKVTAHNPFYRLWQGWHRRALTAARLVITLGEHMAGVLQTTANQPNLPIEIIPNWIDTGWIRPQPRAANPFAGQHGLDERLTVLYSGNLGATHAIETILAVAEQLRGNDNIRFLVIGEGTKQPLVEAAINSGRTPNLRLLPLQPKDMLPQTLTSADVAIVTLAEGYEGLAMPSKLYAMLAAGNAILGISRPPNDIEATLARHQCGVNFRPEAVSAIADWLVAMDSNRAQLAQLRNRARQAAVNHYSTEVCQAAMTRAVIQHLQPIPAQALP